MLKPQGCFGNRITQRRDIYYAEKQGIVPVTAVRKRLLKMHSWNQEPSTTQPSTQTIRLRKTRPSGEHRTRKAAWVKGTSKGMCLRAPSQGFRGGYREAKASSPDRSARCAGGSGGPVGSLDQLLALALRPGR